MLFSCHFLNLFTWIYLILINQGYFANSQRLSSDDYPKCKYSRTLYQDSGEYDIGQELNNYQDFCLYIRSASGSSLTISFSQFSFGFENDQGACVNFVEMGSGKEPSSRYATRYCGSRFPPPYVSKDGYVWIWAHRDFFLGESSVKLRFSPVPMCGDQIAISSYTFITLSKSTTYQRDNHCEWTVYLQDRASGSPLQFKLTNWTVTKQRPLGQHIAKLSFYDGGRNGPLLASFDETTTFTEATNVEITTTSSTVYILYVSDIASTFFNVTVKVKGECIPGTLPCGDGTTCFSKDQLCDSQQQCSTGYDELGCGECSQTEFWCGEQDQWNRCYTIDQRCNGFKDCPRSMLDEINCKTCGPGSFLCKADNKCIYDRWRCDGDLDCMDRSDEEGCTYAASRRVVVAAVIGSLVCSLLLVIALGCTCKLYSLRTSHHRHPHLHYRATPLTRVEREIFRRQAPPTYDMTITGVNAETTTTRTQRNRRRRNRRYQFQRAAPANIGHQCNSHNREERVESFNQHALEALSVGPDPVESAPTQSVSNPLDQNGHTDILQRFGSFLFESMRQSGGTPQGATSEPARTSTPIPVETRDSGTQTSSNRNEEPPTTSSSSSTTRTSSSSSNRRSTRTSSSRSRRSSRGSSNSGTSSKSQQAKPLPKKKRILPVMVSAPCTDVAVEEDILACIYPSPPSYSQAVSSPGPSNIGEASDSQDSPNQDREPSSSSLDTTNEDSQETPDGVFSPEDDSLTVTKSRFFPFSIRQAIRNITNASFSRFQRNPYLQMSTQDSRSISSQGQTSIESTADGDHSFILMTRPSTSSDDDMLDCNSDNESLMRNDRDQQPPSHPVSTATTTSTNGKIFPQRRSSNLPTEQDNHCDSAVSQSSNS